ncbi:hypothetical protein GOP47_0004898 [Adiantum capillus-veneris]|uniref:Protein EARLY FLOWERING 4 domain-containing protein n=1 Tax=Adiantum capillus-veneris TaxID=13818 RepID=A0A9D4ZL27_ADICA|nr:hypothetical protein GOP47_0004898 [Adiantum capillus-veneris]
MVGSVQTSRTREKHPRYTTYPALPSLLRLGTEAHAADRLESVHWLRARDYWGTWTNEIRAKALRRFLQISTCLMKGGDDGSCPENDDSKSDKVWETFQRSFSQVQSILDQNRVLIKEINQNHESKIPENLTRNVALIRELNRNIAKVVELYANLSSEFVQSMSQDAMEEEAVNNGMRTDTDGSNSLPFAGQKKPRHG